MFISSGVDGGAGQAVRHRISHHQRPPGRREGVERLYICVCVCWILTPAEGQEPPLVKGGTELRDLLSFWTSS